MGYREVWVVEVREVLRRWMLGYGLRRIAGAMGLDRKTVRRHVEAAEAVGISRGAGPGELSDEKLGAVVLRLRVGSPGQHGETWAVCEEYRVALQAWVKEGLQLTKVRDLLRRASGVDVPYRTLHRFALRELGLGRERVTVRVADGAPGEELEVDFGLLGRLSCGEAGPSRAVHGLVFTAVYSRHEYVYLTHRQTLEEIIEGFERAWLFFGGIFRVVIIDNMKAAVTEADACAPRLSDRFAAYTQERGFLVDAARVRRPRDKPKVERSVQYVQRNFWQGEHFRSLEDARAAAETWCRDVAGRRVHGTTRKRPLEVFEAEEQCCLLPAPKTRYRVPIFLDVGVYHDHHVAADKALYSVPTAYIGEKVRVRVDGDLARIYHHGQLIKTHPRQPPGGRSTDPMDYPEEVRVYATRDSQALLEKARRAGNCTGRYVERLLDTPLPWTRMRWVYRLLGLVERYGAERVEQACARALDLDVVDVMRIDRMLSRSLEAPPPPEPTPPRVATVLRFARPASEFTAMRRWEVSDDR